MARNPFRRTTPKPEEPERPAVEIPWVEAEDNPWGVRVLDVRPVTLTSLSMTSDAQLAANAVSYGHEDGTSFLNQAPPSARVAAVALRYPIDRLLADGVLFTPTEMEHKWALFYRGGRILCVRSWLRRVQAVADVAIHGDEAEITRIHGTLIADDEPTELTVRVLDFLLRSHAMDIAYPAPLPNGLAETPHEAAMWCMSMFGNRAHTATPSTIPWQVPERPFRTVSLLHLAVAWGDEPTGVEAKLAVGIPIDLRDRHGVAPLHWAAVRGNRAIIELLVDRGSPVDVRGDNGETPLMDAASQGQLTSLSSLLEHGADVDARDRRDFTALHRAAERGLVDAVRLLLDHGATPGLEAGGYTPKALAEAHGHSQVVQLLAAHETGDH